MKSTFTILFVMICAVLCSCGGGEATDLSPKDVAREYYEAAFACGEAGAGRQYDLSARPQAYTREQWLSYQRRTGCRPRPVPHARVEVMDSRGARVVILIESRVIDRLVVVRDDEGWRVQPRASTSPGQRS